MILGIAGTAKNTGKTTTTNAIITEAHQVNLRVGLTSIGYDGEDIDHVTDLPKPRIILQPGDLVAVAQGCLKGSKAEIQVLEETELITPLGKIIIGEVKSRGRVVVAGPNKAKDLRIVLALLQKYGVGLILVDGALNRLAPMVVVEGLILATGAARTPDIQQLALETEAIQRILALPIAETKDQLLAEGGITFLGGEGVYERLNYGSLLLPGLVDEVVQKLQPETQAVYLPGVLEENALKLLVEELIQRGFDGELVLHDPIKLLVGGNPLLVLEMAEKLEGAGIKLAVCTSVPLRLITINPFYPRYRVQYRNYKPDYVDADQLQAVIQSKVTTRVVNVVEEGMDLQWIFGADSF